MRGRRILYDGAELAWLEANCALPIADYHLAFSDAFGRNVSADNLHALRCRKGWRTGRTGRFDKGHVSHNKGVPGCAPGSEKGWFPKGHRGGEAARRYKSIGSERLSKEGYLERKVHDGLPMQSRWRAVHLLEWEARNGAVPAGHVLKCLDGDRRNTDPSNWTPISRSLLPRIVGGTRKSKVAYDQAAAELKPLILAAARLEQGVRVARSGRRA